MVDDLVQETLEACLMVRHALRCDEALLGYVYSVARRVRNHRLHRGPAPTVGFEDAHDVDERAPERLDDMLEARRLLTNCPSAHTHVVALRYLEGHRGVAIAQQLQVSEATVRRRLRRGLADLRDSACAGVG